MSRWLFVLSLVAASASLARAQGAPSLADAAAAYRAGEKAMADGRFDDAVREYGAAYEISKDPVLFFKLGSALDKAGKCPVAITYYRRYLREAKPAANFEKLTSDRIAACEERAKADGAAGSGESATTEAGAETPAGGDGAASSGDAPPAPPETPASAEVAPVEPAQPPPAEAPASESFREPSAGRTAAWFGVAAGLAFVTVGSVFALSIETTEEDLRDLYVIRPNGTALPYSDATRERYEDLVDRGEQYRTLAWVSFGLAGAAAITSTVLFLASDATDQPTTALRPYVGRQGAGIAAAWRF